MEVKSGERGLRQSDALFQHVNNLPVLLEDITHGREIDVICCSERPRPLPIPICRFFELVNRWLNRWPAF